MDESRFGLFGRAFRTYVDIALFRRGPEDVPVSRALLIVTIAASLLLGLALGAAIPLPAYNRVGVAAVETTFLLAWYWALLRFAGRPERFLQTTSAVFGIALVVQPLYSIAKFLAAGQSTATLPAALVMFGLMLEIWLLAINARILRSATQWPIAACVAIMLLQSVVALFLIASLFPEALPALDAATGTKP